ncbi:M23 family metallopeptidase [Embleya sp. NBC_00896]|uniref:M23 family metallopeptidase n=1 Tax=Embleya sp. NBC_00896 TaxID=2975961 RepID=UPI002F9122FF|nr:M23 family metallopeptidase [Embleya sp. NBC_00896]
MHDLDWPAFADDPDLVGADDGEAGSGGWRYARGNGHVHRGIDLRAAVGHPVIAVEDGVAEYRSASVDAGRRGWSTAGNRVLLSGRGGADYRYFHLGTSLRSTGDAFPADVACGDRLVVRAGDVLGFVGCTGGSVATGLPVPRECAHLHFEFHPDGFHPDGADRNPVRFFEAVEAVAAAMGPGAEAGPEGGGPWTR